MPLRAGAEPSGSVRVVLGYRATMVARMANSGAASHLEDGDADIPTLENKGDLAEAESSSSDTAGSSSDDSSEGEGGDEEEEEVVEEESGDSEACAQRDEGEADDEEAKGEKPHCAAGSNPEDSIEKEEMTFKVCCEKCKAAQQSQNNECVTPRRLAKGRLQVRLDGEGTYECSVTGLVFETSEPVTVRYSILSWSKYSAFIKGSWKFAGPIFNVDTVDKEASVLKSIQFPHSVCLADPDSEMTFKVLHIKNGGPLIEPTVDHSGSHVRWNVTSLSPVGPIFQSSEAVQHHGVVMVYKQQGANNNNYVFHVYLAPNSSSEIKDIAKQVRGYRCRYFRIEKPPTCELAEGTYRLMSEPEGEIRPQDLKFTMAVTKMKGYFEAFFEQPPPFKLSLIETVTEEMVWTATIREEDCVDKSQTKSRKRTHSRQRSSSQSEEEVGIKRARWQDESDGVRAAGRNESGDVSEKELLKVAKQLGKEWKQVAIHLGLSSSQLDNIQDAEKDVTMQKLKMLVLWKNTRQQGKATLQHLWQDLQDMDDLPNEVCQVLQGRE